jgi:hypothetical protein
MHNAEPFVSVPSVSEPLFDIGKRKRYKSQGVDPISEELIQAGRETLSSEIHILIKLIWKKEDMLHQC